MALETKPTAKLVAVAANGSAEKVKRVRKNPAPKNETKDAKFKRLAHMRVPKAAKALMVIANLSNTNQYTYTVDQADAMIDYLEKKLDYVKQRFAGRRESSDEFKLS